jgi:hypothetical protein
MTIRILDIAEITKPIASPIRNACSTFTRKNIGQERARRSSDGFVSRSAPHAIAQTLDEQLRWQTEPRVAHRNHELPSGPGIL